MSPALFAAATTAGQSLAVSGSTASKNDLVGRINQVSELVAAAGYLPDTLVAGLALRFQVANLRDANGQPIFRDESFAGFRTYFNKNGA